MIRKISGKNTSSPIKHLSKNHIKATNKKDIADLLANTFSKNSSSTNYSQPFQNIKKNAEKTKLIDNVHATVIPQVPPWTMHHPKVCLDLSVLAKKDTPSHVYIQKFNEIKDQYSYCIPIYTDGSKDNDRVGCGLIINNLSIKQRLPSNASFFTAEVTAIDLALDTIAESDDDHFIIFSDSLSVLLSLHNKKMDNPLILPLKLQQLT